jgi:beta-lactamase superfamily II metal-dependent hydrolase
MNKLITGLIAALIIGIILVNELPVNFRVSFFDVGQGDAIYFRTPDDYTVLIDGGPSFAVLDELGEVLPLYDRTIDLLILSHPHADHVNGFVEVVKRYDVKQILLVGTPSSNAYYQEFLKLIDGNDIAVMFADARHDIRVGNYVFVDILWPENNLAGKDFENLNNASLAVKISFYDHEILLTGDAEIEEEEEILDSGFDIQADIFKAGHHGSKTASSDSFLDKVKPEIIVIQSGEENSFGHPHKEILKKSFENGIKVRRNDLEGRVDFIFDL